MIKFEIKCKKCNSINSEIVHKFDDQGNFLVSYLDCKDCNEKEILEVGDNGR